jgi:hypothetical protein
LPQSTGLLLERELGATESQGWVDRSPSGTSSLIGVCLTETGGYAVGEFGFVARRGAEGWAEEQTGFEVEVGAGSLHSVWIDPDGGVWTVGGNVRTVPLSAGLMLHKGASLAGAGPGYSGY